MSRFKMRFARLLMAGTSLTYSAAALAAPTPTPTLDNDAGQTESATASPSADTPQDLPGDIVVTAQRRGERLSQVPIAIIAETGAQLAQSGIKSTMDLPAVAPSLSVNKLGGAAVIFLRGVGTTNAVVGNESSVALYIDGVYQPSFKGANFDLDSVERVEVLKGPQGTLFGRNATGGALQIIYPDPSHDFATKAEVGYGNYNTFQASGYMTGEISQNLAANLSVNYRNQVDGYGTNLTTGNKNMFGYHVGIRSKLLFTPGDRTRITLSGSYYKSDDSSGSSYQFIPGAVGVAGQGSNGDPFDTYSTKDNVVKIKSIIASLKIEHEASFSNLVSITAFTKTNSFYYFDIDQQSAPLINADLPENNRSLSQEFQLQSLGDSRIKWIAGVYLYQNISTYPLSLSGALFGPLVQQNYTKQKVNSFAAFGQITIPFGDLFNLTLGGRYTIDDLSYAASQNFSGTISVPYFTLRTVSTNKPTWRISLDKKVGDTLLYASYNRGYKTGTYNLIDVSRESPVMPELLDAYEAGLKTRLFNGGLSLDLAGFYYSYSQLQVLVNQGSLAVIRNAASATIKGGEAQISAAPTRALRINGGLSYVYGRFDSYPGAVFYTPSAAGGNISQTASANGNSLPQVPELTFNVGASYGIKSSIGDVTLAGNFYRKGSFYWNPDNRIRDDGYNLTNMSLRWTSVDETFNASAFVNNLFDTRYYVDVQEGPFGDFAIPGAPRTYGVTFGVKF